MSARVDITGILERAGADVNAPEGSQAWALAQAGAAFAELIEAAEAVAFVQLNRRAQANGLGKAKQIRLRAALARLGGAK